jgi:hypothetical protein
MHTIKRLAALQEYEDEESGSTTKRDDVQSSQSSGAPSDWRSTMSPSRLSNLFDGWIHPTTPASPTRASAIFAPDKKSVGEPKLVEHVTGTMPIHAGASDDDGTNDFDLDDFEDMVVCS